MIQREQKETVVYVIASELLFRLWKSRPRYATGSHFPQRLPDLCREFPSADLHSGASDRSIRPSTDLYLPGRYGATYRYTETLTFYHGL